MEIMVIMTERALFNFFAIQSSKIAGMAGD